MTDSGLIGRVSEVGPTSAKVSLVTSDQEDAVEIAAGVQSDDGIFYGVIDQYDSSHNRLIVNQIPKVTNTLIKKIRHSLVFFIRLTYERGYSHGSSKSSDSKPKEEF